jgi:uncharacterized phage-associated protein
MSAYKLQKLLYYVQAWSLAQRGRPAFGEEVRAWKDGPVVEAMYYRYKTSYYVHDEEPPLANLSEEDKEHVHSVWMLYRVYSGDELVNMTHGERPWTLARRGFKDGERSDILMSPDEMRNECCGQLSKTTADLAQLARELEKACG